MKSGWQFTSRSRTWDGQQLTWDVTTSAPNDAMTTTTTTSAPVTTNDYGRLRTTTNDEWTVADVKFLYEVRGFQCCRSIRIRVTRRFSEMTGRRGRKSKS